MKENFFERKMLSLLRPDSYIVWQNEEVKKRLNWYYRVMKNEKPAKFLICKKIPIEIDLKEKEEELWKEHEKASKIFNQIYSKIRNDELKIEELENPKNNFLELKIELVKRMLRNCCYCERRCGKNREKGEKGFCKLDEKTRVATYFLHTGEEAPLVPSGTIFFTSCNFRCVGCQNWDISTDPLNGIEINPRKLALISKELRMKGALNINYVGGEPTPNLHTIIESLSFLNINVPLLWNSNMYCSLETMKILAELIDIWLPDFKYGNDECAWRISQVKNYTEIVKRNHLIAHNNGDIIIRHLVLPNHIECCTRPILEWISKNLPNALVNVMQQWRPEHYVAQYPEKFPDIARRLTREEILKAYKIAKELNIVFEPVS